MHFQFTSITGNNMSTIIQSSIKPTAGGVPLAIGDEIGAFASDGNLCVGSIIWTGKNICIAIWGDDTVTKIVDGAKPNEKLSFKVFVTKTQQEIPVTVVMKSAISGSIVTGYNPYEIPRIISMQ
jgi:hypothetical protein